MECRHLRRTGELLFELPGVRPVRANGRRKDASRAVLVLLKHAAARQKVA